MIASSVQGQSEVVYKAQFTQPDSDPTQLVQQAWGTHLEPWVRTLHCRELLSGDSWGTGTSTRKVKAYWVPDSHDEILESLSRGGDVQCSIELVAVMWVV